ncbi:hypothetical protein [Paenibacillus sinopodophylli]|uniref:hypothetical protein n=1 Tax=Paenibacillus sinopodophylli TaxID=1837342 RepID=UPI00110C8F71|nr:hypothetical protein [Paenibacillus sinopodophylli]
MKKLTFKTTALLALIIVVISAVLFSFFNHAVQVSTIHPIQPTASVSETPTEKDPRHEVIETYISLMQQEQYSKMNERWPNTVAGNTEAGPNAGAISSDDLKEAQKEDLDFTHHFKYHHDQVIAFFGEKAWEQVKYEWTKIPAPEGSTTWIEKSSGKEITFEQAVKLNEQYWNNVLKENNWTEKDVYKPVGEETPEEAAQRKKNYAKYMEGEPTENKNVEDYERYSVQFSFNGSRDAASGEHHFKISIINKEAMWVLYDMLSWNPPLVEPTSDI